MAQEFYVYDLERVSVSFLGLMLKGGAGEGGFIKVTPNAPYYGTKTGVDGSVTRYSTGDRMCKIEIICQQGSDVNTQLAAVCEASINAPNGLGVGTFNLADLNGAALLNSPAAWVEGMPPAEYAAESKDRTWVIMAAKSRYFPGGNFAVTAP